MRVEPPCSAEQWETLSEFYRAKLVLEAISAGARAHPMWAWLASRLVRGLRQPAQRMILEHMDRVLDSRPRAE